MTRREIKDLAKSKLKGRWTNFLLLMFIVLGVQWLVTDLISYMEVGIVSSILSLCNSILLVPFLGALSVVFVIKLVDRDDQVTLKEAIPSCKVWRNFIKKLFALMLFTFPGMVLSVVIIFVSLIGVFTSVFYSSLFSGHINYNAIVDRSMGVLTITLILLCVYGIIVNLFFFPVQYIIVEEPELGIWEAVGKAFKMMKGHKWELFVLMLSFIGWALLAILPAIIGAIIIGLMGWSVKLVPIFLIGLIWFLVYRDTVFRVYYLSIVEKKIESEEKLDLEKESDLEEKLDKDKEVNLEKEAKSEKELNLEKDHPNISVEVDEDDFEI